jgi:hypothetical protein
MVDQPVLNVTPSSVQFGVSSQTTKSQSIGLHVARSRSRRWRRGDAVCVPPVKGTAAHCPPECHSEATVIGGLWPNKLRAGLAPPVAVTQSVPQYHRKCNCFLSKARLDGATIVLLQSAQAREWRKPLHIE